LNGKEWTFGVGISAAGKDDRIRICQKLLEREH